MVLQLESESHHTLKRPKTFPFFGFMAFGARGRILEGNFNMRKSLIAAALLAAPIIATPAYADGHGEAAEPEIADRDWFNIVYIDFHAGKTGDALDMIKEFVATDKALGRTPPVMLRMSTGPYDVMVAFPMRQGIAAMGWKNNPEGEKWNEEFTKRIGGEEAAAAHWAKYQSMVASSTNSIGYIDNEWMADEGG